VRNVAMAYGSHHSAQKKASRIFAVTDSIERFSHLEWGEDHYGGVSRNTNLSRY